MAYTLIKGNNRYCYAAIAVVTLGLYATVMTASGPYFITSVVLISWWIFGVVAFIAAMRYPQLLWGIIPFAYALLLSMGIEYQTDPLRLRGFLFNDNYAAGLLTLTIAFLLSRKREQNELPLSWYALLALPLAVGVIATGSRLALIVTAFSFAAYIYRHNDGRLLLLLCLIGAAASLNTNFVEGLRLTNSLAADLVTRLVPPNGFPVGITGQENGFHFYHNAPVQVAYNAGIPAAMAWLALVVGTLLYTIKKKAGVMLILPAILLCTLDHYFFWGGVLVPLFMAFIGGALHEAQKR
jgi:hypothetical protein|tara:strand:- start:4880 stop:5767 length:888 start_codon:yes stop_codon:yes gene_type:complete